MAFDRRNLLISSLAATAASSRIGSAEMELAPMKTTATTPPPSLGGRVRLDHQARAATADDFDHILRKMPDGILLPASDDDIAATIRWAQERGLKVAAQGQRHSVYGRAQVRGGIVIDMRQLQTVHAVEDDRVVVDAGATWREILAATLPHGLTPPVLTDYLDLSVGGTLVVGGVGRATFRHGAQSDNVVALDVVTGRGGTTTCSPSHNAHLFDAVRAGLGQVAIITRATLKSIKAPKSVRHYVLSYSDLGSMLSQQRLLAAEDRFDVLQGAIVPAPATGWSFRIDAASYVFDDNTPEDRRLLAGLYDDRLQAKISTLSYFDYLDRLAALERLLRSNGQWSNPHPWLMTFVGDSQAEALVGNELQKLRPEDPRSLRSDRAFAIASVGNRKPASAVAGRRLGLHVQLCANSHDR